MLVSIIENEVVSPRSTRHLNEDIVKITQQCTVSSCLIEQTAFLQNVSRVGVEKTFVCVVLLLQLQEKTKESEKGRWVALGRSHDICRVYNKALRHNFVGRTSNNNRAIVGVEIPDRASSKKNGHDKHNYQHSDYVLGILLIRRGLCFFDI